MLYVFACCVVCAFVRETSETACVARACFALHGSVSMCVCVCVFHFVPCQCVDVRCVCVCVLLTPRSSQLSIPINNESKSEQRAFASPPTSPLSRPVASDSSVASSQSQQSAPQSPASAPASPAPIAPQPQQSAPQSVALPAPGENVIVLNNYMRCALLSVIITWKYLCGS